tara:strand:+ start:4924 stop:5667 length:744 start_codon:yes stop_codon:yes gene_type:complete
MNQNAILFIVDHKHRDLPSLSMLGYFLSKKDFKVFYCGTSLEDEIFVKANPKYIVIPKLTYSVNNQLRWKLEGRKIIIVETEGNNQDKEVKYKATVYPDLYLFWNEVVRNVYLDELNKNGTKSVALGFYRSDFFFHPYKEIFVSSQIKKSIGIDNELPIISLATSTQDSHFSNSRLKNKNKKRRRSFDLSPDYYVVVDNMKNLRDITEKFLLKSKTKLMKKFNFVIKPHPNESIIYWHDSSHIFLSK